MFAATIFYIHGRSYWVPIIQKFTGKKTTQQLIAKIGPAARQSLTAYFNQAGVSYPPSNIALLAFKKEQTLELWAKKNNGQNVFIHRYPIKKLSGKAGPKLREGDRQVPEGFYRTIGLNPNSAYYLSIKLNYPNQFDLQHALAEDRANPGSNIFIHGKAVSVGCLAMGDKTIEELFVLAHDSGLKNISVIISPRNPRKIPLQCKDAQQRWVCDLYMRLNQIIRKDYKRESESR